MSEPQAEEEEWPEGDWCIDCGRGVVIGLEDWTCDGCGNCLCERCASAGEDDFGNVACGACCECGDRG